MFLLAFWYQFVSAQSLKRLNYISYNVNEGLLQSQVADLAQDGNGFVWISYSNGVQRFDGRNFSSPSETEIDQSSSHDKNVKFLRLRNGNLWLIHEQGFVEYNRYTHRFIDLFTSTNQSSNLVPLPGTEKNDSIWCWSKNKGFYCFNKRSRQITDSIKLKGFSQEQLTAFSSTESILSSNNFVLLQLQTQLLVVNRVSRQIAVYKPSLLQKRFFAIENFRNDSILIATERGIEKMDCYSGQSQLLSLYATQPLALNPLHPVHIRMINKKICVVSEGNKLFELDVEQRRYSAELVNLQNKPFVEVGYIIGLRADDHENLWVLTENDGIRKINYRYAGFRYFGTAEKQNNFIKSIYADKTDNRVLCGSFGSGLTIYDTTGHILQSINQFPGAKQPYTVCAFRKLASHRYLVLLMGTWNTYLLNTQDYSVRKVPVNIDFIKNEQLNHRKPDYHLGIHTVNDSVSIVQSSYFTYQLIWESSSRIRYSELDSLDVPSISSYMDKQQRLWIGSYGKYFLSANKSYSSFQVFELSVNNRVRCFFDDGKGAIWMGAEKGLYQLTSDGKINKTWNKSDGLVDESIYAIHGDKSGNLWFSHNKGISCRKTDGSFLHFSKIDGLQENEFNTNTSFETADGEIFFGGVNGASSFYPGAVTGVNEKPEVLLTSIMIKDQPLQEDSASWSIKKLSIPYFNNIISFTLTAIGNRSADQYNYQYQLNEQDRQWVNAGNNPQVRYVLQPGNYIFRYYAGNSFEKNPKDIKELYITITPPFWKTSWFRILAIAAIISLVVVLTRRIARRKLKRQITELQQSKVLNEERLRISREMHDDIGAGLTQITLMSEAAKLHQQNIQPLEEIAGTSRKLVGSINEIIWSLNPENQSLAQLLAYLREQLHQLLEYSGINYKIDFPENNEAVILTNAQRRNLLLVTKEIVHNAIKHSKARNIEIRCKKEESSIVFDITDDGIGFNVAGNGSGNGLRNIRRRIQELGGELLIQTNTGAGSQFNYSIPVS